MSFKDAYLKEFEYEAISTRKMLERIPEEKFEWAPHETSMKLGALAGHIVGMPYRSTIVLGVSEFDARSPQAIANRPPTPVTTEQMVEHWDANMEQMRAAVGKASDEDLRAIFTLKAGEQTIFSLPRSVALRTFILNHLIHHRGQLSVYMRTLEIPVPSIYGPSGDEN